MKNRIIGLGIFALIFSFNLLFSGTMEARQATMESLYAQCGDHQDKALTDFSEIRSQEGILQHHTETSEVHHLVRKYPATVGLLFLLLHQPVDENPTRLLAAHHSFSPSKDFPVSYHNLRI